jgi:2-(1,2-epoxy-1,2-dihydrophenyl)acetyl-CoA isomerase
MNRRVGADEALQWGLVTTVVEDDQLLSRAEQVARQLFEGPLQAIGRARRLLSANSGASTKPRWNARREPSRRRQRC